VTLENTRVTFVEVFSFQRSHPHFSLLFNRSIYKFTALNKVYEQINKLVIVVDQIDIYFFNKPNVG